MEILVALLICLVIAVSFGKTRKFLRNLILGPNVYVIIERNGTTEVYKNPNSRGDFEDAPLAMVPDEILYPERFYVYYNVCWFHCGQLLRCEHATHKTPEQAENCRELNRQNGFVAKVFEQS